jgi:hypothetical protein
MRSVVDLNVFSRNIPVYIYIYIYIYLCVCVCVSVCARACERNLKVSYAPNHSSDVKPSRNPIDITQIQNMVSNSYVNHFQATHPPFFLLNMPPPPPR